MSAPRYLAYLNCAPAMETRDAVVDDLAHISIDAPINLWAADPVIMLGTHGAIIGHLFTRALPSRRINELNAAEINAAIVTQGQSLIRDYWGGYVAIFQVAGGDIVVVRDPSGTLPAYWRQMNEGIVLTAQVGTPPFAASDGMRVDPDALLLHMWRPFHAGERTCLAGVREIVAGCRLRVGRSTQCSDLLWKPWDFTPGVARLGPASAELLHATIVDAIKTWAGEFPSIALGLSGGLDSSMVCAGLIGSSASCRAFHMNWTDREADELSYAQLVATALDMPLDIFPYDQDALEIERPIVPLAARPLMAHYAQSTARAQAKMADQHAVGAFFTGHGGDNVFGMMHSVAPLIDRARGEGCIAAILATMRDIARVHDASYATILLHLCRRAARGAHPPPQGIDSFLDGRKLKVAQAEVAVHPWLSPPSHIAPGTGAHIRALSRAVSYEGFHDRRLQPPTIAPLLAQPVMELCLGIPSWRWIEGGIDRSVARKAFASDLPTAITARRTKSGPAGFLDKYYWDHEERILSYLRSGILAEQGLLHGLPLPNASGAPTYDRARARRLIGLAGVESWARQWSG